LTNCKEDYSVIDSSTILDNYMIEINEVASDP